MKKQKQKPPQVNLHKTDTIFQTFKYLFLYFCPIIPNNQYLKLFFNKMTFVFLKDTPETNLVIDSETHEAFKPEKTQSFDEGKTS